MSMRCVHCGTTARRLMVRYSPGNIRLMKCESCNMVADPYVECEVMILLNDLILHKEKAYRHLLHNMLNEDSVVRQGLLWKSTVAYMVLEIYRSLFLCPIAEDWHSSRSLNFPISVCSKAIMVLLENIAFFSTLHYMFKVFFDSSILESSRTEMFLAILLSSYMKVFMIAMMVWEFPSSVIFIIDMFVLSSNAVALKVLTEEKRTIKFMGAFLTAYVVKLFAFRLLVHPADCSYKSLVFPLNIMN